MYISTKSAEASAEKHGHRTDNEGEEQRGDEEIRDDMPDVGELGQRRDRINQQM